MKHLLNGVAIAAALAITAPAWAQNAPQNPPPPPAAQNAPMKPMAPAAGKPMGMKKPMKHMAMHRRGRGGMMHSADDSMTDQLNQQELARIQGGGGPAPAAGAMEPSGRLPGPKAGPK